MKTRAHFSSSKKLQVLYFPHSGNSNAYLKKVLGSTAVLPKLFWNFFWNFFFPLTLFSVRVPGIIQHHQRNNLWQIEHAFRNFFQIFGICDDFPNFRRQVCSSVKKSSKIWQRNMKKQTSFHLAFKIPLSIIARLHFPTLKSWYSSKS